MMAHTRRIFLPQRRKGAKKALRKRDSALRLCAFAGEILAIFTVVTLGLMIVSPKAQVDEVSSLIDAALYTRHEFFGAQAIVPFPTAEARNRLADGVEIATVGKIGQRIMAGEPVDILFRRPASGDLP